MDPGDPANVPERPPMNPRCRLRRRVTEDEEEMKLSSLAKSMSMMQVRHSPISPEEWGPAEEDLSLPPQRSEEGREIKVGDVLPYGQRLFDGTPDNVVRMKDIGVNKRLIVIGVTGSFTPDCWNRHMFRVLQKYDYFIARHVHNFCCVATNDTYAHTAWGQMIGAYNKMLFWSDTTTKFTRMLGMDTTIPFLDSSVRSKRYVILADDMVVTKMIMADDQPTVLWKCDHFVAALADNDAGGDDDDDEEEVSV